jgi:diguanylate cyclase (GGDEF)-like protein
VTFRAGIGRVRAAFARDERIAHLLGGLLFMAGGIATAALVLLPGSSGSHESLALVVGIGGLSYGALAAFVLPWERMPFLVLHAAGLTSLAVIVTTSEWTGGSESPIRFIAAFIVVWAACFCRPAEIVVYVVLASATFLAPLVLQSGLDSEPFLREQVVVFPALGAIALTVALLRHSQDRASERANRVAAEQRALVRVATAVADGAAGDALHAQVAEEAAGVLGAHAAAVLRFEPEHAVVTGAWSDATPLFDTGARLPMRPESPIGRVHAGAHAVHTSHSDVAIPAAVTELGYREMAVAAIELEGVVWGAIVVGTTSASGLPSDADARLADFGALVTTALVNAVQRDRLAAQAFSDPLTSLANHRAFHERLTGEAQRARRHGRELSLVLIDVDTFKAVNDSAGHEAGDRVLAEVASKLRGLCRSGDLLARIGGDEFGWLLPETGADAALVVVERAREAVAAAPVAGGHRITISAGVCDLSLAHDADELFRLADGALYWSKAHGRDTARVYDADTVRQLSATERAEHLARHQALLGIRALARAIDAKDQTTREHSGRVATLACALARHRGWSPERIRLLEEAAVVHDVGKIGIADAILQKPGPLTEEEYEIMKTHSALGFGIVSAAELDAEAEWILHHHERLDGRGYPDALVGDEIKLESRIILVADAFEAMTSDRSYRKGRSEAQALAELERHSGTQFDPVCVAALRCVLTESTLEPATASY